FWREKALASLIAASVFSMASLNAWLPATVNCSTVVLMVSAADMGLAPGSLGGGGHRGDGLKAKSVRRTGVISCCSAAVKRFLCTAQSPCRNASFALRLLRLGGRLGCDKWVR